MPLVRLRLRALTGASEDQVDYEHEVVREYDFVASVLPRLYSSTAWVGPVEMAGMPDVVDVLVENTDAADDIRFYYKYSTGYKTIAPGEVCFWPNVAKGSAGSEWRIIGQGAGLVDCKVTVLG